MPLAVGTRRILFTVPRLAPDALTDVQWTSAGTDNTPNFSVIAPTGLSPLYRNIAIGDKIRAESSSGVLYFETDALTSDDILDGLLLINAVVSTIADGSYPDFRFRIIRPNANSAWATVENGPVVINTADMTAPTLSSLTGGETGVSTASYVVTTNEANGDIFYVYLPAGASVPDGPQIEAGTDGDDDPALIDGSLSVSGTGVQAAMPATGLDDATEYDFYAVHKDDADNYSNVVTGTFETDAIATGIWILDTGHENTTSVSSTIFECTSREYPAGVTVLFSTGNYIGSGGFNTLTLHVPDFATDPTGTAITVHDEVQNSGRRTQVAILDLPSAETGVIRISTTEPMYGILMAWWMLDGADPTPADTAQDIYGGASMTCPVDGGIFALASIDGSSLTNIDWTNLTETFYDGYYLNFSSMGGAYTLTSGTATRDWSSDGSISRNTSVAIALNPAA